jgi:hypothetical protein
MIKIIRNGEEHPKQVPFYFLEIEYLLADTNRHVYSSSPILLENPYLERFVKLLNSLCTTKDNWGIIFERKNLPKHLNEHQITEDDYQFLARMMYDEYEEQGDFEDEDGNERVPFFVEPENEVYANQFFELIRGEAHYDFLVFENAKLTYFDEYDNEFETEII